MPRETLLVLALAFVALAACDRSERPSAPRPAVAAPVAAAPPAEDGPQAIEAVIESDAGSFSFEAYAYDCGEQQVTVRPGDSELTLILADREIVLPQVTAASGARYVADGTGFWGKGINSGVLTLDGEDTPCRLNRPATPWVDARARGATFRGIGQEPGWHLEIHPERIVMVYEYGERRMVTPNLGQADDPDRRLRRWEATTEAHTLLVEIEDRACTDTMSGEIFPAKVTATLDGLAYAGCGRDLE